MITSTSYTRESVEWSQKFAKGEYRIVKDIYTQKSDGTYEKFYVAAEFSMK